MDNQNKDPMPREEGSHLPSENGEPDSGDLRRLGEEGGPVGLRVGRDPANLGDEVPEESDLTLPQTEPARAEM
jgi:hypothetical protein